MSTLLFHNEAFCGQVTLAWDPVSGSGLAGYRVHYGTVSRNYPFAVDAGNQTTVTVTGLPGGVTYYFAATAYDTAGTESPFSSEVVYTMPQSGVSTSYTITASAGANGSISPAGQVTVGKGASRNFTITPASGYKVAAVTVDGASVGAVTSYAFSNVTNNHSISATFTAETYTITASAATNGSISPSESVTQTATACTLAVARSGSGWGTVTKSPLAPSFPVGTVVTLTAAPSWSSVFSGWSGACSGTSRTCTLTMTSDASVTATFKSRWAWVYTDKSSISHAHSPR